MSVQLGLQQAPDTLTIRLIDTPRLQCRVVPHFPGSVVGGTGITVTLTGVTYTIAMDDQPQPQDDDLTAIAALEGTGVPARTGFGTWALRQLVAPAAGVTVTNPAGVAGHPTLALANDLAAVEALAASGFAARTATDTWAVRTWQQPAAGVTISNADGVAGNPALALANDLAALEGLASTGFAARTATDTWAQRSLTQPAAGLTITNPAGIAGNPTFALANDLASLEAASGTNTIYYRSAADTWSAVSIGATLFFTGGTLDIPNDAITYAKMQNVSAASKLIGRGDSGAGDPQEITIGAGLSMSGTTLSAAGGGSGITAGTAIAMAIVFG